MATFFLMMTLNPAVQEKAQAQIDVVVGKDRLPTMDDRPMLPWIDAIFRGTLRYSPVVPLCEPLHPFYIPLANSPESPSRSSCCYG